MDNTIISVVHNQTRFSHHTLESTAHAVNAPVFAIESVVAAVATMAVTAALT